MTRIFSSAKCCCFVCIHTSYFIKRNNPAAAHNSLFHRSHFTALCYMRVFTVCSFRNSKNFTARVVYIGNSLFFSEKTLVYRDIHNLIRHE